MPGLYDLVKAGGLAAARAAASLGRSIAGVAQSIGAAIGGYAASAYGALAQPAYQQAQQSALGATGLQPLASGYLQPTGQRRITAGANQYTVYARWTNTNTGLPEERRVYFSSSAELTAREIANEVTDVQLPSIVSPTGPGGSTGLPPADEIEITVSQYYRGTL